MKVFDGTPCLNPVVPWAGSSGRVRDGNHGRSITSAPPAPEAAVFAKEHAETIDSSHVAAMACASATDDCRLCAPRGLITCSDPVARRSTGRPPGVSARRLHLDATIGSPLTRSRGRRGEAPFGACCPGDRLREPSGSITPPALRRLFLVPIECTPDQGAYVDYPRDELLRILAETSKRFRCIVIVKILGSSSTAFEDLAAAGVLSPLNFVLRAWSSTASSLPTPILGCLSRISTHDHQTLAGWWRGADIQARLRHGIVPPDVTKAHVEERRHEREDLWQNALDITGIAPAR